MTACDCVQCRLRRAREDAGAEPATPEQVERSTKPAGRLSVQVYRRWFPVDRWEPPAELTAVAERVPVELRAALKVVAFDVCRVAVSGPASHLCVADVDDDGQIVAALVDAGLIELYETPSGVVRWARTPHGETDA